MAYEPNQKLYKIIAVLGIIFTLIFATMFATVFFLYINAITPTEQPQPRAWGVVDTTRIVSLTSFGISSYEDGFNFQIGVLGLTNVTGVSNKNPGIPVNASNVYVNGTFQFWDGEYQNWSSLIIPLQYPTVNAPTAFTDFLIGLFNGTYSFDNFTDVLQGLPLQFVAYRDLQMNMQMLNLSATNLLYFINETIGLQINNIDYYYQSRCYNHVPKFIIYPMMNYTLPDGVSLAGIHDVFYYYYMLNMTSTSNDTILFTFYSYVMKSTGIPLYTCLALEIFEENIPIGCLYTEQSSLMYTL